MFVLSSSTTNQTYVDTCAYTLERNLSFVLSVEKDLSEKIGRLSMKITTRRKLKLSQKELYDKKHLH